MAQVLAQAGPLTLYTHDVFTVVGILAAWRCTTARWRDGPAIADRAHQARRDRGGALGARLITGWEVLDEVPAAELPLTYAVTHGPRSIIGGLAGDYLAIVLSKRALGYALSTGDHYAAAIPLALVIGRVGCFLSELPLGGRLPRFRYAVPSLI